MKQSATGRPKDYRLEYEAAKAELEMVVEAAKRLRREEINLDEFHRLVSSNFPD